MIFLTRKFKSSQERRGKFIWIEIISLSLKTNQGNLQAQLLYRLDTPPVTPFLPKVQLRFFSSSYLIDCLTIVVSLNLYKNFCPTYMVIPEFLKKINAYYNKKKAFLQSKLKDNQKSLIKNIFYCVISDYKF